MGRDCFLCGLCQGYITPVTNITEAVLGRSQTQGVLGRSPTRAVLGKRVLRSEFSESVVEESTTGAFKERGHQQDDISCRICVWIEL
jgi:hypothetical protein